MNGHSLHASRLELIKKAKSTIYLSTYIYENERPTQRINTALCKKAMQGLEVKVIVDHRRNKKSRRLFKKLQKCGAKVLSFLPRESKNAIDRRLIVHHEKLLIVDGLYVLIGGSNYGSLYYTAKKSNKSSGSLGWYDHDYLLEGILACRLHHGFQKHYKRIVYSDAYYDLDIGLQRWSSGWYTEDFLNRRYKINQFKGCTQKGLTSTSNGETSYYLPIVNNPYFTNKRPIEDAHVRSIKFAIHSKRKHIKIYSPYFVATNRIINALAYALDNGVKVSVITNSSATSDEPFFNMFMMQATFYQVQKLLDKGLKVYMWNKNSTLHRKGGTFSEELSFIGSDNFDSRGQHFSSESVIFTNDPIITKEMNDSFGKDLKDSFLLTREKINQIRSKMNGLQRYIGKKYYKYF